MLKTVGEKDYIWGHWFEEGLGCRAGPVGSSRMHWLGPSCPCSPRPRPRPNPEGPREWRSGLAPESKAATRHHFMSTNSMFDSSFRFLVVVVVEEGIVIVFVLEVVVVVGILRVLSTETAMVGTMSVPVASMIACSACTRGHRKVSPSDL
jgi:hypothetical protein